MDNHFELFGTNVFTEDYLKKCISKRTFQKYKQMINNKIPLENSKDFYADLKRIITNLYNKHSRIIYNGNSYAKEWEEEAKKRKLKNIKTSPEAFKAFITENSIKMFEEFNVYRKEELISRKTIDYLI